MKRFEDNSIEIYLSDERGPRAFRLIGAVALAAGLVAAAAMLLSLSGCGASTVQIHARAAEASGVVLREAKDVLIEARREALERVERETYGGELTDEQRVAAIQAEMARWEPAVAGMNVVIEADHTWVESIALAHALGNGDSSAPSLLRLALRVPSLYTVVADLVEALGVDRWPALPDFVAMLGPSIGGE